MNGQTETFEDGAVIFAEGDEGAEAFVVLSGEVSVFKALPNSEEVRLARLGDGELFGEIGLLDGRPRTATARATGRTKLQIISKAEFLERLEMDNTLSLKVMKKLARRLREADDLLVQALTGRIDIPSTAAEKAAIGREKKKTGPSLLARLFSRKKTRTATVKKAVPLGAPTKIVLCGVGDVGREDVMALAKNMAETPAIKAVPLSRTPHESTPEEAYKTLSLWAAEEQADLFIAIGCDGTGRLFKAHFIPGHRPDKERAGLFTFEDALFLPRELDEDALFLFKTIALAALVPGRRSQVDLLKSLLPIFMPDAERVSSARRTGLSGGEQAAVLFAFGNAAAVMGLIKGNTGWLEKASAAYEGCLKMLPREAESAYVRANRQLGHVRLLLAEAARSEEGFIAAAEAFAEARGAVVIAREEARYAALTGLMGDALYKRGLLFGDEDALKEAVAAYQEAVQHIPREKAPEEWADMMTAFARALQLYGDQMKNADVLQKAVEVCESALQVRTRAIHPLAFADSRSNQASALFLLGRQTNDAEKMEQAVAAFEDVLALYQEHKVGGKAKTVERNLERAKKKLEEMDSVAPVQELDWALADDKKAT